MKLSFGIIWRYLLIFGTLWLISAAMLMTLSRMLGGLSFLSETYIKLCGSVLGIVLGFISFTIAVRLTTSRNLAVIARSYPVRRL